MDPSPDLPFPPERPVPPFLPLYCPAEYDRLKVYPETGPKTILFGSAGLGPGSDPQRPFGSFLAPLRLEGTLTEGSIVYDVEAIAGQDPRPLDYLAASEIEAFRSAAERFLDAALPTGDLLPAERALRTCLRLPNPDREPECYWTYGPETDRRLLIFWGVERDQGTSLPPISHEALPGASGATVLSKLREMPPQEKQRRALRMLLATGHPLAEFFAARKVGPDGQAVLVYGGQGSSGKAGQADAFPPPGHLRPVRPRGERVCR